MHDMEAALCAASCFIVISIKRFMVSFFGNKEIKPKTIDRVFISSKARLTAILEIIRNQPKLIFITWFEESSGQLETLLLTNNPQVEIYMAKEIAAHNVLDKPVVFFEHYPLITRETELIQKLQLKEAIFFSALEDPLFKHFGGDKIISMMEKMGLSENEAIEHPMITNAIRNAQEKISQEVSIESHARSQAEWFSKNIVK